MEDLIVKIEYFYRRIIALEKRVRELEQSGGSV